MALYVGLMSGTSMDAVDAALVDFSRDSARLVASHREPIPDELRTALLITRRQVLRLSIEEYGRLHIRVGKWFARAVIQLVTIAGVDKDAIVAIGSHGQTLLHKPDGLDPFTLQIGDANTIAHVTGVTTIADFRGRDIAAGGQGAPLTPAFHQAQFRRTGVNRVVLNLGGIANITVLPADPALATTGFDTGPGNAILDDWALDQLGTPMDRDGQWARGGRVNLRLLARAKADPYFELAPPKSTGREYFNLDWINALLRDVDPGPSATDVQATLVKLTAETVAEAICRRAADTQEILVCGGGARNPELMRAIADTLAGFGVCSTERYGLNPDHIEAIAFAWLAKCRLEGRPGNLPSVTGAARPVVLGAIYSA